MTFKINLKNILVFLIFSLLPARIVYSQFSDSDKIYDTLPVELVYFYPVIQNNGVLLKWGTATEVSNYGFEVQRSISNYNFEMIGFVEGNGNSNSPKDYEFLDSLAEQSGLIYYRLKQIDFNGTSEYSDTVKVDFVSSVEESDNSVSNGFILEEVYPNPFNSSAKIIYQLFNSSKISLKVYDLLGSEVVTIVDDLQPVGRYETEFLTSQINSIPASGVFFIQLRAGKFVETKKILYLK